MVRQLLISESRVVVEKILFFGFLVLISIGVFGFPKIEIEGKPQIHFQTNFIKLMLEYKGGSTEERKVL